MTELGFVDDDAPGAHLQQTVYMIVSAARRVVAAAVVVPIEKGYRVIDAPYLVLSHRERLMSHSRDLSQQDDPNSTSNTTASPHHEHGWFFLSPLDFFSSWWLLELKEPSIFLVEGG